MQGRKKRFKIGDVSLTLARPTLPEAYEIEPILQAVLGDPNTSEFTPEIDQLLKQAVEHESDKDKAALESIQDYGDKLELFDAWCEFGAYEDFLLKRGLGRLERIKRLQVSQLQLAGMTEQEANDMFKSNVTTLHGDLTALGQGTDGRPLS